VPLLNPADGSGSAVEKSIEPSLEKIKFAGLIPIANTPSEVAVCVFPNPKLLASVTPVEPYCEKI